MNTSKNYQDAPIIIHEYFIIFSDNPWLHWYRRCVWNAYRSTSKGHLASARPSQLL